jgi:hypothetical protein
MVSFAKVSREGQACGEDGDVKIKEEGISKVRLFFPCVLSRLCVMKSVRIN